MTTNFGFRTSVFLILASFLGCADSGDATNQLADVGEVGHSDDAPQAETEEITDPNAAAPCIELSSDGVLLDLNTPALDFGLRHARNKHLISMMVRNCARESGGDPLRVNSITLRPGSMPDFNLPSSNRELPLELPAGASFEFPVSFSPEVEMSAQATLDVESNAQEYGRIAVSLSGTGDENQRPHAVAKCKLQGFLHPAHNWLFAQPFDTLRCTATESEDAENGIEQFVWSFAKRPVGANSEMELSPGFAIGSVVGEEMWVGLDVAGNYELRLVAKDVDGLYSSDDNTPPEAASVVSILVVPKDELHIELTWETPADLNLTDEGDGAGADLDLHLLHPNGCWNDILWDCHFRAIEPNWGDNISFEGDPSLDLIDNDGAGPEVIGASALEPTSYHVAVHYYEDFGFGPSLATLKIYVHGAEVFQAKQLLSETDTWWIPAEIRWSTREVVTVQSLFSGVPPCP